jgi:hypothetical protein
VIRINTLMIKITPGVTPVAGGSACAKAKLEWMLKQAAIRAVRR